ncbi:MAG: prephenate dehydratase domain-containing protein [Acidobacteriota bacterium]
MISSGHSLDKRLTIAFQGEHGAFSEEAAFKLIGPGLWPRIRLLPCATFQSLFGSLDEDRADYLLAPVSNSLAGVVHPVAELLQKSSLATVGEVVIQIHQNLIGCPGTLYEEIQEVESHPVALAQCSIFFAENPQIKRVETDDTAGSVARIIKRGDHRRAAIAGKRAAEIYGGTIIRNHVEDHAENYTRFLLLSRND